MINLYTALGSLIGSIAMFVAFILFSIVNYEKKYKTKYKMSMFFPYELNYEFNFRNNLAGNLCLLLSTIFGIVFFIFFDGHHIDGYFIFILIAGIIGTVINFLLFFVPLKHLRSHLALIVFSFCFSFLVPLSIALASLNYYNRDLFAGDIVICVIAGIICLFIFILVMNPKLSKWANMDVTYNEKGEATYVRPKRFVLAYTEWALIIANYLSMILVLILAFFVK